MASLHHYLNDDHPDLVAARQHADFAAEHLHHASELLNEILPDLDPQDEITLRLGLAGAAAHAAQARAGLLVVDRLDTIASMVDTVSSGVYHYADNGLVVHSE